jgi:thymidine phosphorylase
MVEAQGGDPASVENPEGLERAPCVMPVVAPASGTISAVDCFRLGELVVRIGGGRRAKEDTIDPRVGIMVRARIGDRVEPGMPLAELHLAGRDDSAVSEAVASFTIGGEITSVPELVLERIG